MKYVDRNTKTTNGFPESEQEAKELAKDLADRLAVRIGGNWKPHVWHNLWWCYKAKLQGGSISVREYPHYNYKTEEEYFYYSTSMSSTIGKHSGTPIFWSDNNNYDTPEKAVLKQIEKANNFLDKMNNVVQENTRQLLCFPKH